VGLFEENDKEGERNGVGKEEINGRGERKTEEEKKVREEQE
jgi:hypothetical protein